MRLIALLMLVVAAGCASPEEQYACEPATRAQAPCMCGALAGIAFCNAGPTSTGYEWSTCWCADNPMMPCEQEGSACAAGLICDQLSHTCMTPEALSAIVVSTPPN